MSEFDEWFKSLNEGGRTTYFLGQEWNISKEAWGFQQVKIDCMQVRLDGANERALSILNHKNAMVDKMQAEIDEVQNKLDYHVETNADLARLLLELQGQIDKVVHILTYTNHASTPLCNELRDILKGNKDEN